MTSLISQSAPPIQTASLGDGGRIRADQVREAVAVAAFGLAPTSQSALADPMSADQSELKVGELRGERIESAFGLAPLDTRSTLEKTTSTVARSVSLQRNPSGLKLLTERPKNRLTSFVTEQRWHGYVKDVAESSFNAIVYDASADDNDVEEVEFDKQDVHILMRDLIQPGAIFFWDIGYEIDPGEQRNRKSVISFPTLHRDTKKLIEAAKTRARARFDKLGWGRREQHDNEPEERARY